MATILDKAQATLANVLANPGGYWGHFDLDDTVDSSHRISAQTLMQLSSTTLYLTDVTALNGTEPFILLVEVQNGLHTLQIPTGRSHITFNCSTNGTALSVISSLASESPAIVEIGGYCVHSWNTTTGQHEVYIVNPTVVDAVMSGASTNPVRNSVVKAYVDGLIPTIDSAMSSGSTNPVRNNVIKAYVDAAVPVIDAAMSPSSANPVQNQVVKAYIDGLVPTIDSAMSDVSTNPVRNSTIKAYVDASVPVIDAAMSAVSNNAVRNSTIKAYVDGLIPTVDSAMSAVSNNPVRNSTIKAYVDAAVPTIDAAMSAASTNPVQNQVVKSYIDALNGLLQTQINRKSRILPTDRLVEASGNEGTDSSALSTAIGELNTQGYGTLWLKGRVKFNTSYNITAPISIKTVDENSGLHAMNSSAVINYGSSWNPITSSGTGASPVASAISATSAFDTTITSSSQSFAVNDWVVVMSYDAISGTRAHWPDVAKTFTSAADGTITATAHGFVNTDAVRFSTTTSLPSPLVAGTTYYVRDAATNTFKVAATPGGSAITTAASGAGTHTATGLGQQSPMEMHRIYRDNGSSVYSLGDFIVDPLTINPLVRRVPIISQPGSGGMSNVVIEGLRLTQESGASNVRFLDLRCIAGLQINNVCYEEVAGIGGAGYIFINFCSDITIDGVQCQSVEDYDGSSGSQYCIQFGAVNGATMQNSFFRKQRHGVDTTAAVTVGKRRWGTPRNVLVSNNVFFSEGNGTGLAPVSTHPEGWGFTVSDNLFVIADQFVNAAAWLRARNCIFRDNTLIGSGLARGVIVYSDDNVISGNLFQNLWIAVEVDNTDGEWNNMLVSKNDFLSCVGGTGVVKVEGGTGHSIEDNVFDGCVNVGLTLVAPGVNVVRNTFSNGGSDYYAISATDISDCLISHNTFDKCPRGAIEAATGGVATIAHNVFRECGAATLEVIQFTGTGASSSGGIRLMSNSFIDCPDVCIAFLGGASGVGNNQKLIGNEFIGCGSSSDAHIKFADDGTTTGHTILNNVSDKGANSYFIDLGSVASGAVKLMGNVVSGYGAGSLGLNGTNAATVNSAQAAKNFTD